MALRWAQPLTNEYNKLQLEKNLANDYSLILQTKMKIILYKIYKR
jgi:hypothetical protein